ncbi:MAG: hypothetical protein HZB39_01985 [Planctomycetes bacterium]|nr:hypothetical protein [Planctomycetota bacterium]
MVKKSSFLEKLKNRLRSHDVRVAPAEDFTDAARSGEPQSGEVGSRLEAVPTVRENESVSGRKLSPKEEATLAVQDGFRELNGLLRGMQTRVEEQGERFVRAADGLVRLPELGEFQLQALRRIAEQIEEQGRQNAVVVQSLGDLPRLLGTVRDALDRAATVDERTAGTLDEFRAHMARIQGGMERMVDHSRQHVESARSIATGRDAELRQLQESTKSAVSNVEKAQQSGLRSLREAHEDQANRLRKLVEESTRRSRAMLVLLGLVLVALLAIGFVLAVR